MNGGQARNVQPAELLGKRNRWPEHRSAQTGVAGVWFWRIKIGDSMVQPKPRVERIGKSSKKLQQPDGPIVAFVTEILRAHGPSRWKAKVQLGETAILGTARGIHRPVAQAAGD